MNLYVMTGPIQTGKTTWTMKMLKAAHERGLHLTGVVSPAIFEGEKGKTGIDSVLLPSGERFTFAKKRQWDQGALKERPDGRKRLGWDFRQEAFERINGHFIECAKDAGDLFVVDEFGALEFYQNKGFTEGLKIMDKALPKNAYLILRPDLLEPARERWGDFTTLGIDSDVDAFLDGLEL